MTWKDKNILTQDALIQKVRLFGDKADRVLVDHLRIDDRVEIHLQKGCIH